MPQLIYIRAGQARVISSSDITLTQEQERMLAVHGEYFDSEVLVMTAERRRRYLLRPCTKH